MSSQAHGRDAAVEVVGVEAQLGLDLDHHLDLGCLSPPVPFSSCRQLELSRPQQQHARRLRLQLERGAVEADLQIEQLAAAL